MDTFKSGELYFPKETPLQLFANQLKNWVATIKPIVGESEKQSLDELCEATFLQDVIDKHDSAYNLLSKLRNAIPQEQVASKSIDNADGSNLWCAFGNMLLFNLQRYYPALTIYEALYEHQLDYQLKNNKSRIHKGLPLFRIADCYQALNMPVHTKRYLMLTLIEDAITGGAAIGLPPEPLVR
jgi:hypothetical protein